MIFKKLSLTTALVATFALAACGGAKDEKKADTPAGAGVIKIATASPMSGGQATVGKDNESGARLAVEEINAKGGVDIGGKKYMIELVVEDDAGDPKQGTTVAQKIADDKSISAVVGHYNSGVTMVAEPIYAKANLVSFTVSSNPDVTLKATKGEGGIPMVYRMASHDGKQGPALAAYAQKKGYKTIAIFDDATAYGKGLADQVEKTAKEAGMTIATHESATDKTTDFKSVLTKIKASNVDAIMWGGYDDTAASLVKQARELGIKAAFLMPDAVCTDNYLKLAGTAASGTICSATGLSLADMKDGATFKANFEKRFPGQTVQAYAPLYYDGVYTAIAAVKKAGSTDRAKVAAAMKGLTLTGLSGPIAFDDATGERKDTVITILEEKNKAFVPVDKIK
ncbi:branched-chain amino acid ABC transporter substrate-binding protein [Hydromonas duriensis]|uniref:Amino acid/amide ABC transporter substrate-binding protein (HAAT family) n=1 Tax=Hydromonas duriensis TaxID=1527608 RepID=A0A4R6YAP9_9BURK|nr:branched-chain amino acid ABC transporter substrate-binding protein [Hydromonas duriensis]TDR32596.1 amino acid/amide ABC transporter substrate-binding protein (HAAT family) [Hydromonas duriensis]